MTSSPYLPTNAGSGSGGYSSSTNAYSGYGESAEGGYLRGYADVINSQGKFLISLQQRDLLREQVRKERIDNSKRLFDQYLYERDKRPTWEDERQRDLKQILSRSLNDPPIGEIRSASALNSILADLQKKLSKDKGLRGPPINLDEEVVRHINLATPGSDGNAGLLRNEGRLNWPLSLKDSDYRADRELLNNLIPEAIHQAVNGRVDAGTLREVIGAVDRIKQQLRSNINDLPPAQYMEAKSFINNFDDALKILRRPDAGDFFSQKYAAQGKNVAELVKYMLDKGLRFAPAVAGDEAAYMALHRALAAYDAGANAEVAADRPAER